MHEEAFLIFYTVSFLILFVFNLFYFFNVIYWCSEGFSLDRWFMREKQFKEIELEPNTQNKTE